VPRWWQRIVDRRHRPHTPGVWVLYYAIAALPLFALGQWLIPSQDTASRMSAFRLLMLYVGSALGLLLTTSFLGLRRYLRQRKLEMPPDMAGLWLGLGAVMILAVLLLCVVLPRPGAVASISRVPWSFGSPQHERTDRNAVGKDGPEQPSRATGTRQDAERSGPRAETRPGASDKSASSADGRGNSQGGDSRARRQDSRGESAAPKQAQSRQSSAHQEGRQEGRQPTDNPSSDEASQQQSSGQPQSSAGQGDRNSAAGQDNRRWRSPAEGDASPKAGGSRNQDRQAAQPKSSPSSNGQRSGGEAGDQHRDTPDPRRGASNTAKQKSPQRRSSPPPSGKQSGSAESSPRDPSSKRQTDPNRGASALSRASRWLSGLLSNLGALLKLLFWAALLVLLVYVGWKHREQIAQALRQLIHDLKILLAGRWGGAQRAEVKDDAADQSSPHVRLRPFASYRDPFATGGAARYSNEQLVRYTFEALEAWARERAIARGDEQTPLEFAQHVGIDHPNMAAAAQQLADLYCRVAYGHEPVPADRRAIIQQLWRSMRATASMPPPPPLRR